MASGIHTGNLEFRGHGFGDYACNFDMQGERDACDSDETAAVPGMK